MRDIQRETDKIKLPWQIDKSQIKKKHNYTKEMRQTILDKHHKTKKLNKNNNNTEMRIPSEWQDATLKERHWKRAAHGRLPLLISPHRLPFIRYSISLPLSSSYPVEAKILIRGLWQYSQSTRPSPDKKMTSSGKNKTALSFGNSGDGSWGKECWKCEANSDSLGLSVQVTTTSE